MKALRRIFIAAAMQASCRVTRILATPLLYIIFIGFFSAPSHAKEQYDTYSPVVQAELDAARERRKELARRKIDSIIHGSNAAPTLASQPKPLLPPSPPTPTERPPFIAPPPAPVTVYRTPPPPPVTAPPDGAALFTPASPPPWHTPEVAAPPPVPEPLPVAEANIAPSATLSPAPPPAAKEGIVADKTYIVGPGLPPPPPAPPLTVHTQQDHTAEQGVLPEVAEAIDSAQNSHEETLAPETEAILDALPEDIIGKVRKDTPGDFSVDRMDPSVNLPDLTDTKTVAASSESPGMKVVMKQRPVDVNYELEKAYVALTAGNTEEAIATYKNIVEIAPKNEQALFGLATTYHRIGMLDEARPIYGKLLKINPRNKDAINNFLVLVGEEAPERALEHMKHLEAENPEFAPIPAQMALLYSRLGDMPSSIKSMQRAVNISPENLVYKYNLAILYDKAGKPVEASMLYQQLLEARYRGEVLPADADEIQQRLTFLLSNK